MEKFKIYIDRLKNGHVEKFTENTPSGLLGIEEEEELAFHDNVHVKGEAYLADDHLVAHFAIETSAYIPCSICNKPVRIPIAIKDAYSTIPLTDLRSPIYDLKDEIRETILIQVPLFAECNEGKCPEREIIQKFFNKTAQVNEGEKDPVPVHFPFADLDKE